MLALRFRPGRVAALIAVGALITLSPNVADTQGPKRGGTLRVSYGNEIANLDFHTAPGYELNWVAMNIGCGLLGITPDGKFVPDAAESWQISPDGLLYTFKLRKNVLFHDGTRVDAAAVKFSIDRIMDPATKSSMRTYYEPVHSVEVVDPLHRADPAQGAVRVHAAHAGRVPHGPGLLLAHRHPEVHARGSQERQAGGGRGLRALPARRVGEGQPPGHGPLRQVLRSGASPIWIAS